MCNVHNLEALNVSEPVHVGRTCLNPFLEALNVSEPLTANEDGERTTSSNFKAVVFPDCTKVQSVQAGGLARSLHRVRSYIYCPIRRVKPAGHNGARRAHSVS